MDENKLLNRDPALKAGSGGGGGDIQSDTSAGNRLPSAAAGHTKTSLTSDLTAV